ncbi:hypothetical protein PG985_013623 [Apiospora marii]|uniref:F-box domain-containing protein n=1 Tax=Apiospora marii TaxID=335849 RepID=A0ABR1R888_9PEZI
MHHAHDHEWTVPGAPTLPPNGSPDKPGAAQHQVLHTPELLEKILASCGDMRAVLLAQRVSLFWHDMIRHSSLLQTLLYFEPVPPFAPDEGLSPEELRDSFSLNPLLRHYFPEWLRRHPHGHQWWPQRNSWPETYGVISFARHRCQPCEHIDPEDCPAARGDDAKAVVVAPLFPPERREAFTRAGASWRRMLVCQPASMALGFHQTRREGTMPTEGGGAGLRRPWPNPGWRQDPVIDEVWQYEAARGIRGFLDTSSSSSPLDTDDEGGGLRMGTLYDVCLAQHLYYSTLRREDRHPYFRLHWLPPGYAGIFPHHTLEREFKASPPGLGVSSFAVLEDMDHHSNYGMDGTLLKTRLLDTEELESFRCDEHTERLFTPVKYPPRV